MRKSFIALYSVLMLFIATPCFAQDYWVYVRTYDRSGVTKDDDAGRSKAGDVVTVLPDTPQFQPSETEKKEYLIFKVKDLQESSIKAMTSEWMDRDIDGHITAKYAYRKNKIDFASLTANKEGLVDKTSETASKIMEKVSEKTSSDLSGYEVSRISYLYLQRPLEKLARIILPYAWASTVTSTINKTGEDYNTLTLWEDAKDGDLVTATTIQKADCYDDDGVLADNLNIDGSTTSVDYYMLVNGADKHVGTLSDGASGNGFLLNGNGLYAHGINISDDFTRISWIQLSKTTSDGRDGIHVEGLGNGWTNPATISNCIIYFGTTNRSAVYGYNSGGSIFENCIIFGDSSGELIHNQNGMKFYNCSIFGNGTTDNGIGGENNYTAKNCIIGNTDVADFDDIGTGNVTYCISEDATVNGLTGCHSGETMSDIFTSVTDGSENFHLKSTATNAIDGGIDLSATLIVDEDIDNTARSGSWDIGADEATAGGPSYFMDPIIKSF
jgi:hypothetical protein